MKYITYEELQKWIIREGCDDGCGYIDERDIVNMDWQEDRSEVVTLSKIRAEIDSLNPVDYVSMSSYEGHRGASDMKDDVLNIIDKYRKE